MIERRGLCVLGSIECRHKMTHRELIEIHVSVNKAEEGLREIYSREGGLRPVDDQYIQG